MKYIKVNSKPRGDSSAIYKRTSSGYALVINIDPTTFYYWPMIVSQFNCSKHTVKELTESEAFLELV